MTNQIMITYISASIDKNVVSYWLDVYPLSKVIHKHNCNEISFYWYNCLVFIKNGCEIKMIETQSDVMRENIFYWKSEQYNEEKLGWLFDILLQWIKWSKPISWNTHLTKIN